MVWNVPILIWLHCIRRSLWIITTLVTLIGQQISQSLTARKSNSFSLRTGNFITNFLIQYDGTYSASERRIHIHLSFPNVISAFTYLLIGHHIKVIKDKTIENCIRKVPKTSLSSDTQAFSLLQNLFCLTWNYYYFLNHNFDF